MADSSRLLARKIRTQTLRMVYRAGASHIGTCLSMADILAVVYCDILRFRAQQPTWEDRDRFILSKGHGAAALYAVLAETGFFPLESLDGFSAAGSPLCAHATSHNVPGIEISTGSLGHGLSIACGLALAGMRRLKGHRVVTLLSDGELNEGAVWEAAMFASHHRLANMIAIVDYNKIQSFGRVDDVMRLEPLADKWRAFGWDVQEADGHDHDALREALSDGTSGENPKALIAHTVKGKGVSFMEDHLEWHYRTPDEKQLAQALAELGGRE